MKQTVLRKGPEIRRRILLILTFLTPLLFVRNAYDVFNVPKLWLLMVGLAFVGAIRAIEFLQGAGRFTPAIALPAAAVAGSLIVGTLLSPYQVWSLIGDHSRFTGLVPYLVVIGLGVLIADGFRGDTAPLAWAFTAAGAVAGLYAVIQVVGLDPLEWSQMNQATTTIGNTNFAGAFFAICLPVGLGLFLEEKDRRLLVGGLTVFIAAGWVGARSEAAWAAGAAGLFAFGGIVLSTRWARVRVVGLFIAAAIATAGVGLVVAAMADAPRNFIPSTIERRAEWWQASLRMTAESPLFGRGPNSFAIEHTHHRDVDDVIAVGSDVTDDPHSLPLSFLIAGGILGAASFLVVAGWVLLSVLKLDSAHVLGAGFAGAASAYLIQSLLSVDVITLRFAGWAALGATAAALAPPPLVESKAFFRKKKRNSREIAEPLKALPVVAAIIVVASVAVWWSTGFLFADIAFRRALSSTSSGASAQEDFRSAIRFRESNDTYRREYAKLLGANAIRQALDEDGDEIMARKFLQEAEENLSFVEYLPHANSVFVYARVIRDWAEFDPSSETRALALYERAAQLDPYNFLILEEAARVALSWGREDAAQQLSERAAFLRALADA